MMMDDMDTEEGGEEVPTTEPTPAIPAEETPAEGDDAEEAGAM